MASTVNVPMFGPTSKGKVAGIVIGGGVLAGYLIYKKQKTNKKQTAAAQAAAAASAANAYGYGAASYGYGDMYATGYYGYGASGGFNATGYYGYGTPYPQQVSTPAVAATTNAQWAQAAIAQLTQEGYTAQAVSAALGAYEQGAPVTSDQQTIIQSAIGIEGYPPDAGANGYPPSIHVQATPGGGTGGGQNQNGSGGSSTGSSAAAHTIAFPGPSLNGKTIAQAQAIAGPLGFTVINNNNLGPNDRISSFTTYSNGNIRTG